MEGEQQVYKLIFEPTGRTNEIDINKYIKVGTRPSIPSAEEIVNSIKLGDGTTYYDHTGNYYDRKIQLECNFVARNKNEWLEKCKVIQEYFKGGKGKLYLPNDDAETYWIVKDIALSIEDRWMGIGTHLTIEFTVDPYRYIIEFEGAESYTNSTTYTIAMYNPYADSLPMIRLYYSPLITDFSITNSDTGNEFTIDFNDSLPHHIDIDVEDCVLKYVYANGTEEIHTELTTGSFDDLIIPNGSSEFVFASNIAANIEIYRRYKQL